jgi:hypothetical protein
MINDNPRKGNAEGSHVCMRTKENATKRNEDKDPTEEPRTRETLPFSPLSVVLYGIEKKQ